MKLLNTSFVIADVPVEIQNLELSDVKQEW
jgi:hypothetical protein